MTEKEALKNINSILAGWCKHAKMPLIQVLAFSPSYNKDKSLCQIHCAVHGNGDEFDHQWRPRLNNLRRAKNLDWKNISGCPKCHGNYRYTEREYLEKIAEVLKDTKCSCVGFIGDKINKSTPCKIECKVHKCCWEFENPHTPSVSKVLHGSGKTLVHCNKCTKSYRATVSENIQLVADYFKSTKKHLTIKGIIGAYKGMMTPTSIRCQTHGFLKDFGNSSTPNFESLQNRTFDCPKCKVGYHPTEAECITEINNRISLGIKFVGFHGKYCGRSTPCILNCYFHGDLSSYCDYTFPDVDRIINQNISCYMCAKERRTLSTVLGNSHQFHVLRTLYYAEFMEDTSQCMTYKIGVRFGSMKQRYPDKTLNDRGLILCRYISVKLPNILACIAEVVALAAFYNYKNRCKKFNNWGMSECFGEDVIGINDKENLEMLVSHSTSFFGDILNSSKLSSKERKQAKSDWEKIGLPITSITKK
ncbi:MAG: hypothetical protein ACI9VT_000911, partial [Psychroserpens sp.]